MKMYPVPIDIVAEVNRMYKVNYKNNLAVDRLLNAFSKKLKSHELYDLIEPIRVVAQKFEDCDDLSDLYHVVNELKDTCKFYNITLNK